MKSVFSILLLIVASIAFADPLSPKEFGGAQSLGANPSLDLSQTLSVGDLQPAPLSQPQQAAASAPASLSEYPQVIQNIVRACDGDPHKIFDLIRNHVEFQPYFGFKKSPETTWLSRRGNDADQALLLVECLEAAGLLAQYGFGLIAMPTAEVLTWFGVNDINALYNVVGNAGYYYETNIDETEFALEQIWAVVDIGPTRYFLSPSYKTFVDISGIDLEASMNFTRAGLLAAAGGTETPNYAQSVVESTTNDYLENRASDFVSDLLTNHSTASMDEIVSGRRILPTEAAANFVNGFYSSNAVVAGTKPAFYFPDPYGGYEIVFGGNLYSYYFYTYMHVAVGTVNAAGDQFNAPPFIEYYGPSSLFSGKNISVTFDENSLAQMHVDGDLKAAEAALTTGNIGIGYEVIYPFQRSGVGTTFDEVRIRPIKRDATYVYAYDSGGSGERAFSRQGRLRIDQYRRDGLTAADQEVLAETLYLLGLDWLHQFDLMVGLLGRMENFTPVIHHTMALIQQEEGLGVDVPTTTLTVSNNSTTGQNSENLRSIILLGSAMEHGVIEQNYPEFNAVSTVRYVRENNLAGGKTFYATASNYDSAIKTDSDFIAGWSSEYRDTIFPDALTESGAMLIVPEDGSMLIDSLEGRGYFMQNDGGMAAFINTDTLLNGGYATTQGLADLFNNDYPWDATFGPDSLDNPLSDEPVDMLTGAYVYDSTDLSLSGQGVRGLAFTRHYSSLAAGVDKGLGKGWSHNYQTTLVEHSDTDAALGGSTPVHAASLIAALWAVRDMMELETSPKAWVVGSLAAYWGLEQIKNNTVTVNRGRETFPFTRLADGSFVPPAGMTAVLTQDSGTGQYSMEGRFDVVSAFNADGKFASITDSDGKQLTISYVPVGSDGEGQVQTVTDANGRTLTFSYVGDYLDKVTDSTGRVVDFSYTGDLLTGVTDPEGHTVDYAHDSAERIATITNQKDEVIAANTYDELGQVCFQVAENDVDQEWEYAFTGILNVEINPDGDFLSYIFDEKGRTIATINGEGDRTELEYDGQNQVVKSTDPRDNITRFEYDDRNNLRFVYDARNGESGTTYKVERHYDAQARLHKVIDEAGKETVYDYDTEHHLTKVTDPLLRETNYTYYASGDEDGLLWTIVTPGSTTGSTLVTTISSYDSNGYPVSITRPDNSVLTQTFNALGDLTFSEITTTGEPNTYPVTYGYDLNRRRTITEDSLGFGSAIGYDPVGNVVSTTDRHGNQVSATFTPLARMDTSTGVDGRTTVYGFDDSGRRTTITDPLGQVTGLTYDLAGRLKTETNPKNEIVTYGYDDAGNRAELINARTKTYQFAFTANNLLDTLTTPLSRVFDYSYNDRLLLDKLTEPSLQEVTYAYYDDQQLEQLVDTTGTIDFDYDAKGRLWKVTEGTDVLTRGYDALDRITSFTDSAGNTIGYEYDGGNHLTQLTYPASKGDVTYVYDNAGRLATVTDWASRVTQFVYDTDSRLDEIQYPNGTKREFFYDSAGRVERQVDTHIGSATEILEQRYSYDALGRIEDEIVIPEPATYAMTPAIMTYDNDDRITGWQSGAANITPGFDDDGNMTSGPLGGVADSFVYDSRNRLTAAGTATYVYDVEDRRVSKTEGGVTTTYVHEPHGPLSRLLQKTTGGLTTYYVYAAGQLLYEETGGVISVYHADSRGSTLAISDSTGSVTNRITYGTYGKIVAASGTLSTPFLYNGAFGVQTDENGLLHMRARYYSPELRRFVNADPILFAGGMNWFVYAGGDPVGYIDPNGETPLHLAAYGASVGFAAFTGAVTGSISGAIAGYANGDILGGVVGGFVGGAAGGAAGAAAGAALQPFAGPTAGSLAGAGLGAAAGDYVGQYVGHKIDNFGVQKATEFNPNYYQTVASGLVGAAGGVAGRIASAPLLGYSKGFAQATVAGTVDIIFSPAVSTINSDTIINYNSYFGNIIGLDSNENSNFLK